MSASTCFWCDKLLFNQEKTKDHLMARFLFERYGAGLNRNQHWCVACEKCNMQRGQISGVFEMITRYKNNDWKNYRGIKPLKMKSIHKIINTLKSHVNLSKIKDKIEKSTFSEQVKDFCLLEINEVINWRFNMRANIIVAANEANVIGNGNTLPWSIPEELKHFKNTTKGSPVIMGRVTFESIPPKIRPLPGRKNIVISKSVASFEGAHVVQDLQAALEEAKKTDPPEVFICGGAQIYKLALESGLVDRILLSRIYGKHKGDVYLPEIGSEWKSEVIMKHNDFEVVEMVK